jgi:molybdopterin biosynthesis enzyme
LVSARLAGAALHRTDRRQYLRCRLATAEGVLMAHPASNQGSHITTSLVGASGLLIVYEGEGAFHDGDTVPVLLLNDGMPWGA